MTRYYMLNDEELALVHPLFEKSEYIIGKLYGNQIIDREKRNELNEEYDSLQERIQNVLCNMEIVGSFDGYSEWAIEEYLKRYPEVKKVFWHNYVMNTQIKTLAEMENRLHCVVTQWEDIISKVVETEKHLIIYSTI